MATVTTVNFNWVLPVPGSEIDLWGDILNDAFGITGAPAANIDADLWAVKGTADAALPKAGGTMTGALNLVAGTPTGQNAVSFAFLDANYASLVDISVLAPLASPVLTGNPTAPTPSPGDSDASIATTAFVAAAIAAGLVPYATLANPAFTGNPTAPTPALSDNDTSIATTAFVQQAVGTLVERATSSTAESLVLGDISKMVSLANASPVTLTVPTNASVAFPVGTRIDICQLLAGQVTVVGAPGVTIISRNAKVKLSGLYAAATLWQRSANVWLLVGDLTT